MEMTKKTKVFVSVTLVCALSLTIFTGCTFGFRTPDYIAFGWSPIAQEGAIWRSTDGVIVIDSRNYAINGYIVINGEKVTIDSVEFSGKSNIMVFSHATDGDTDEFTLDVSFQCSFKSKNKFIATVDEVRSEKFDFLKKGDKFIFIKDQE